MSPARRKRMKNLVMVFTLALFAGCAMSGTESTDVTLSAVRTGNRVTLMLRNGSATPVGYNLCSSGLQRSSGAAWEAIETDEVCTMELRTLERGGSATFEKNLPSDLQPGEYRYVTNIDAGGTRAVAESNPFRVE
jgi:hypothetical protein